MSLSLIGRSMPSSERPPGRRSCITTVMRWRVTSWRVHSDRSRSLTSTLSSLSHVCRKRVQGHGECVYLCKRSHCQP
eukprot:356483-Chlamydomonas_euryale.AAC.1